jgi:uncharacterized membrane protein YfhO
VRRDLDFGASYIYKIPSTSDYNSMVLGRYYHFIDLLNKSKESSIPYYNVEIPPPNPRSSYIDFLNIKYVLSDKSSDLVGEESSRFKMVLEGDKYKLYQNKNFLPRFYLVNDMKVYEDEKSQEMDLLSQNANLNKTVMLLRKDVGESQGIDLSCNSYYDYSINILSYSQNKILLEVKTTCNRLLTSSEIYYPGWKAKVDGLETKIYQSNFAFRTIYLPKGTHEVEFYYHPFIYYLGGIISLITFGLVFGIYIKKDDRLNS